MKQSTLADLLQTRQQSISKYETGRLDLDTDTIRRLCEIFGVTADYLLGLSSRRSPELTEEEARLLAAYRAADPHTRDLVDLALEPYKEKEKTNAAAG